MTKAGRLVLLLALVLGMSPWLEVQAQSRRSQGLVDMSQDSVAARMVMASILGQVRHQITDAAFDTARTAWDLELPRDGAVKWSRFRDHLFATVLGRAPSDAREARYGISIVHIGMRADTLIAEFIFDFREYCGREWMGTSWRYEMRAIRHGTAYEYPLTRELSHADGACTRVRPPPLSPIETGPIDSLFQNARVRVQSPLLPAGWTTGEFIRIVRADRCLIVAVESPRPAELQLSDVTRLQVSTRYFGRPASGASNPYIAGGDTLGERWRDVDLERIRARDPGCRRRLDSSR